MKLRESEQEASQRTIDQRDVDFCYKLSKGKAEKGGRFIFLAILTPSYDASPTLM